MVNRNYLADLLPGVMEDLQRKNRESLYFNNPALWAQDYLGIKLWSAQEDALNAIVENKNVIVKAGHGVGKSFSAGILICWWIDTRAHLPGGAFVVSTAPSFKQVNNVVWDVVRTLHALSKRRYDEYKSRLDSGAALGDYQYADHALPGYITAKAEWALPGGKKIGYGTSPPDGKEDTMQGIHRRYVLAIGDEAVGLPESIIRDLGAITTNDDTSRRYLICNPTNPASYVGKVFKQNTGTWVFKTISVFDSPRFHGGGRCECPEHDGQPFGLGFEDWALESMVGQSYVDDMKRDFGEDHPMYISRVLGEWAWDAGPMLISPEELAIAEDVEVIVTDGLPVLGVDVSRSDDGDMNVVYACTKGTIVKPDGKEVEGYKVRFVDAWNDRNAMHTAEKIRDIAWSMGSPLVKIDGSGLGGPIGDRVAELSEGRYILAQVLGGKPAPGDEKNRFYNLRAWSFADMRRKVVQGLIDIDHEDKVLQDELLSIQTKFPAIGVQRLLIESKEDMKRRGVGSPDYADAFIYSLLELSDIVPQKIPNRVLLEFDENYGRQDMELQRAGGYGAPI